MGREIAEAEGMQEEGAEEEEEEELEFPTDADAMDWEDPSENGVLGDLFQACEAGDLAAVQRLAPAAAAHLNALGPEGDTLLHLCSLYGFEDIALYLLELGVDPGIKDDNAGTALHDASAGGYLAVVRRLLELRPALVAVLDGDQETALHCAARGGHPEVVAALLAAGADKSVANSEGLTPLHLVDPTDAATAAALA